MQKRKTRFGQVQKIGHVENLNMRNKAIVIIATAITSMIGSSSAHADPLSAYTSTMVLSPLSSRVQGLRADTLAAYTGTMDTQLVGTGDIVGGIFEVELVPGLAIQLRGGYADSFGQLDLGTVNYDNLPPETRGITQAILNDLNSAGKVELEDFCIVPLEVGLVGRVPFLGFVWVYAGGGAGYYVVPAFDFASDGGFSASEDIDYFSGYWGLVGVEAGFPHLCLFAEAKYTKIVQKDIDIDVEYYGYTGTLTADVDLSGMSFLAGVRIKW